MSAEAGRAVTLRPMYPIVLLLAFLFALCGQLGMFICFVTAVLLHESGHVLMMRAGGIRKSKVGLAPFAAKIPLEYDLSAGEELTVALGGPFASVVGGLFCAGGLYFFPNNAYFLQVLNACVMLACVNILPAFPLDGGRVLHSLLRLFMPLQTATTLCVVLGVCLGGGLLGLFVYALFYQVINISALALSLLLIAGALSFKKQSTLRLATATLGRKQRLQAHGALGGRSVTVRNSITVHQALLLARGAGIIYIVDDDLHLLGTVGEGDLLRAAMQDGLQCVGKILRTAY